MKYEIVHLEEKKMLGLHARTNNSSPNMGTVIGGLWEELYSGTYEGIKDKVNQKRIGAYCEYESDASGDYTIAVGCEVNETTTDNPKLKEYTIPAGKYAKFVLQGNLHDIIGKFWQDLWSMDLDRTYDFDFEEYQDFDLEDTTIIVYIGIR